MCTSRFHLVIAQFSPGVDAKKYFSPQTHILALFQYPFTYWSYPLLSFVAQLTTDTERGTQKAT